MAPRRQGRTAVADFLRLPMTQWRRRHQRVMFPARSMSAQPSVFGKIRQIDPRHGLRKRTERERRGRCTASAVNWFGSVIRL